MVFKNTPKKYSLPFYLPIICSIILILFNFTFSCLADRNEEFKFDCEKLSKKLRNRMGKSPSTTIFAYEKPPLVADGEQFAQFMIEKMEFLADELAEFIRKYDKKYKGVVDENIFFDRKLVNRYVRAIKETTNSLGKRRTENPSMWVQWNRILDLFIFGKNPAEFIQMFLNGLMLKLEENEILEDNTKKNEKISVELAKKMPSLVEYEGGEGHSIWRGMVQKEFVILRKYVDRFVAELKAEIVYGQGRGAFDQIGKDFEENGGKIIKEIRDMHMKYWKLYNLLNNATQLLYKNLVPLISDAVDGVVKGKKMPMPTWTLAELILKSKLAEASNEKNSELVECLEQNLEISPKFLDLEAQIVKSMIRKDNRNDAERRGNVRASKIRISAGKVLLAYERLKNFYLREPLEEEEMSIGKENAKSMIPHLEEEMKIPEKKVAQKSAKKLK